MFIKLSVPKCTWWFTRGEYNQPGTIRSKCNQGWGGFNSQGRVSEACRVETEPVIYDTHCLQGHQKPVEPPELCGTFGIVPRPPFRNRKSFWDFSAPSLSFAPTMCSARKNKTLLEERGLRCGQEEHSREKHSSPPFILLRIGFSVGIWFVCN